MESNKCGGISIDADHSGLALTEGIPRVEVEETEVEETEDEGMVPERELSADVLGWTFPSSVPNLSRKSSITKLHLCRNGRV